MATSRRRTRILYNREQHRVRFEVVQIEGMQNVLSAFAVYSMFIYRAISIVMVDCGGVYLSWLVVGCFGGRFCSLFCEGYFGGTRGNVVLYWWPLDWGFVTTSRLSDRGHAT